MLDLPLTVELVPSTAWYSNLRSVLPRKQWDFLRKRTYSLAGNRCEVCGGKGRKHPVEAHEKWEYDDEQHIQRLVGLVALCPSCHECKHPGLAESKGRLPMVLKHMAKVNRITEIECTMLLEGAFELWARRSNHKWKHDISWLDRIAEAADDTV